MSVSIAATILAVTLAATGERTALTLTPGVKTQESVFRFDIMVPLASIKERIEKEIPTEVHYGLQGKSVGRNGLREEVENKDIVLNGKKVGETRYNFFGKYAWAEGGGKFGPPGLQYYIYRHPLSLTANEDGRISLAADLDFKVAVAINCDTGVLIKPWIFGDAGFGSQWPRTIAINVRSTLQATQQYGLESHTSVEAIPRTEIVISTFHGVVRYDAKPSVVKLLRAEGEKLAAQFDAEIARVHFESEAKKAWEALYNPIALDSGFFMQITPIKVQVAPIRLENGYAVLPCAIVGSIDVVDKPTREDKPTPLPPLEVVDLSKCSDRFRVALGISLTRESLQRSIRTSVPRTIDLGGGTSLMVTAAQLEFHGDQVKLTLRKVSLKHNDLNAAKISRCVFRLRS